VIRLRFVNASEVPVLWLGPLARLICELIDHRLGNLLVSDTALRWASHIRNCISAHADRYAFSGSFQRFFAEVLQWADRADIPEGGL
jgi:hypothetical protein